MNAIAKNATIVTGGLIFLGFCRYYFYYSTFGIDIYNYITASELLLSFLPVVVGNIIPIALIIYLALLSPPMKYKTTDGKDFTLKVEKSEQKRKPTNLIKHIFFTRSFKFKVRLKLILLLILNPLVVGFGTLMFMTIKFWSLVFQHKSWNEGEGLFYIISFGWLVFIIEPVISKIAEEAIFNKEVKNFMQGVTIINYMVIFAYFMLFSQKILAWKKMSGECNEYVSLILKTNDTITTSKTLIYIGQTNEYLFFSNTIDSVNMILERKEVYMTLKGPSVK